MPEARIKTRWVRWNLLGIGKDRSPFEHTKFAYRGPVLYAHEWPVGRIVHAPNRQRFVTLVRPSGWIDTVYMNTKALPEKGPRLLENIHVEDLGVFSKYPDDMIDEAALHERTRQLFLAKAAWIIEVAETVPETVLVTSGSYYRSSGVKLLRDMDAVAAKYLSYKLVFQLKWKEFPPNYQRTIRSIVENRTSKYESPAEVAKRERKAAREQAKKALGLDEA